MDEILIEDKKYISSKLAAKITGYAKDYIGQLCREGRVPARLVGRGWYVLESAIQDHRFGNPNEPMQDAPEEKKVKEEESVAPKTWEFPRYESVQTEILPSINRLNEEKSASEFSTEEVEGNKEEVPETPQNVHDSWKQWFDTVAEAMLENKIEKPEAPTETMRAPEEPKEEEEEDEKVTEDAQINVPLRVVSNYFPTKEIQQNYPEIAESSVPKEIKTKRSNAWVWAIQVVAYLLMILSVTIAVAGSGYFDAYVISNSQVHVFLGVTVYNK